MQSIYKMGFLFMMALLLIQCRKDTITKTNGSTTVGPSENVNMLIKVVDEQDQPVKGATIRLKEYPNVEYTDENGVSIYQGLSIPSIGLLATIMHPDYETQYKMINGASNSGGITKVMLLNDLFESVIRTGESGNIDDRGFLTLPNLLVDKKGNEFIGNIKVLSKYIDPDDSDFLTQAPGSLLAENSDDELVILGSLGMYLIELYDEASNTPLNIPSGEKATIRFHVAEAHQGNVPNEIPLWSFNEENGLWTEEGEAILDGDFMVADVSHFSFWNCDLPYEFVDVKMTFIDENGELLVQNLMTFRVDNSFQFGEDITNSDGVINGKLPLNKEVIVELHLITGDKFTATIAPVTNGDDLTVQFQYTIPAKISGKALQCMGNAVEKGYVIVHIPILDQSTTSLLQADGTFEMSTVIENQDLTFVDAKNERLKEVSVTREELESTPLLLGDIMLCDESESTSISGFVHLDDDEDGIDDAPIENIKVILSSVIDSTEIEVQTDANGYYNLSTIPGTYTISIEVPADHSLKGSGDFSIDDSFDFGSYFPSRFINCNLDAFEQDEDNNFQLVKIGTGSISGAFLFDLDNDGIGDKGTAGVKITVAHPVSVYTAFTDENGLYTFENIPNAEYFISSDTFAGSTRIYDYDFTPDPDGDDNNLGPNYSIPIKLLRDEQDSDNNFLTALGKSIITCSALADTDNDNIGDAPISDQRLELYRRSNTGVPMGQLISWGYTNDEGVAMFQNIEEGEYVIYFIGSAEIGINYDILGGVDLIPDNNPTNTSGEKVFIPINIVGTEFDDGNTYTFKEK